jgi:hypothetical protein
MPMRTPPRAENSRPPAAPRSYDAFTGNRAGVRVRATHLESAMKKNDLLYGVVMIAMFAVVALGVFTEFFVGDAEARFVGLNDAVEARTMLAAARSGGQACART